MKKSVLNHLTWVMAVMLVIPVSLFAQERTNKGHHLNTIMNIEKPSVRKVTTADSAKWLHWDDGANESQWGFAFTAETFDLVSKWDPAHITNYDRWKITKMRFIIDSPTPILTIKIWEGPATTEVYSQDVGTFTVGSWTEIVLDTAQEIDASTELWAGLNIQMQYPDMSVVATDHGPPVDGYGNLYRLDDEWYSDYNNQNVQIYIEPVITADFAADTTNFCYGTTVNFSDSSLLATSWEWTFEGGIPATSTDQNPSVLYNTPGDYDVTLVVSDGTDYDTLVKAEYISVLETPAQADQPEGDTATCTGNAYNYTTNPVAYASDYEWELSPADAGTLTSDSTSASLQTATDWTGDFTISVRATNMCGDGIWSDNLEGIIYETPEAFELCEGGEYCDGGTGVEITQDGSTIGVDYELFLDGTSTDTIVAGTGSEISYGFFTDEGQYTATGSNGICSAEMDGAATITVTLVPEQASTPVGDTSVCAGTSTDYTVEPVEGADTIIWTLTPSEAGIITGGDENISIEWDDDFEGIADLIAQGENECGLGDESVALEITCSQTPTPEISGLAAACEDEEADYSTEENAESTYDWTVTGGEITMGEGTHQITVLWGTPGNGTVDVTETVAGTCTGTAETFEVTIDECTGITETGTSGIKVYPNPASDKINIQSQVLINSIRLYSFTGKEVLKIDVSDNDFQINTSKFQRGIYLLVIETDETTFNHRVIIN